MRERGTNLARGFGFCDYMEPWQVEKALQMLHNKLFRGRPLRFDRVSNKKVYILHFFGPWHCIPEACCRMLCLMHKISFICVFQSESIEQYVRSLPHHELWDILSQFQVSSVYDSINLMIAAMTE